MFCLFLSSVSFVQTEHGSITNKRGLVLQALDNGALGYICLKWALDNDAVILDNLCILISILILLTTKDSAFLKINYFYANGVYKHVNKENIQKLFVK